jgi:hypothetical protein
LLDATALAKQCGDFGAADDAIFRQAVVDKSVFNRPEVTNYAKAQSNKMAAYVGDAHLSHRIAPRAFKNNETPANFQDLRSRVSARSHLATVYDSLFAEANVVVRFGNDWRDAPTESQKAEFVESLIGLLLVGGKPDLANWLVWKVLEWLSNSPMTLSARAAITLPTQLLTTSCAKLNL